MVFPLLGPLLGFAGTIGSSLIGAGRKQETVNRVDYKRMVADAEAAGFNPLTALRAGGAAGFTTTTHPALSAAGGIGAAFSNLGQQITDYDPNAAANEQLSRDLQRAQLENIQADTKQRMRSFDVAPSIGASVVGTPGGWSGTEPGAYSGMPLTPTVEQPTLTNPHQTWQIDPATPDAAAWEERYGEPGGIPGAMVTLEADLAKNVRERPREVVKGANQVLRYLMPSAPFETVRRAYKPEITKWFNDNWKQFDANRRAARVRERNTKLHPLSPGWGK